MKFWEVVSAFRCHEEMVEAVLTSDQWDKPYGRWFGGFAQLVKNQDRSKLDSVVPDELVSEIARRVGPEYHLYLSGDWLRAARRDVNDVELSAFEVVERFGGSILEEVQEYGSARIQT